MNFTDFSFWWFLFILGGPILAFRVLGKQIYTRIGDHDRIILALISLSLFWFTVPFGFTVFIVEIVFNYIVIRIIQQYSGPRRQIIIGATILVNIIILVYFKSIFTIVNSFTGFFCNFMVLSNWKTCFLEDVGIPLGISFYTFQMISFLIDISRSNNLERVGFLDYVNCMTFFPKIIAGPIERWSNFYPQLKDFRLKFSVDNIDVGLRWFSLGFFAKFVIADNLARFIDLHNTENPWIIILSTYLFGLKLYFDFAGYSFISIGISKMLGINLMLNFRSPYMAANIQEFWNKWHISLSTWLRDYLYSPIAFNLRRLGKWGMVLALILTFLICGLWHGIGWNFVLWGIYHGLLVLCFYSFGRQIKMPKILGWIVTFNFVMLGWIFFMETNILSLLTKLRTLIDFSTYSTFNILEIFAKWTVPETLTLAVALFFVGLVFLFEFLSARYKNTPYEWLLSGIFPCIMLFLTILCTARSSVMFVYFNF